MKKRIPKYCHHKGSNQGFVTLNGRRYYCGKYNTEKSIKTYNRLIAEWIAGTLDSPVDKEQPTVAQCLAAYLQHCERYYRKAGQPTSQYAIVKSAVKPLAALYSDLSMNDLRPGILKTVLHQYTETGVSRGTANKYLSALKTFLRWCLTEELLSASTYTTCSAVPGLKQGRSSAKEPEPIRPIPDDDLQCLIDNAPEPLRSMIELQVLTACRPGELCGLRNENIRMDGPVWTIQLESHKTSHHGKGRILFFGPKAQIILQPLLESTAPGELFFPLTASQYRYELKALCEQLELPRYSPNQLRHTGATKIRSQYDLETAQLILGHSSANMTEIYAEKNLNKAVAIMKEYG